MKKPPAILFLILCFIWSTGKDLDNLIRSTGTTDYYIFSAKGLAPLYFVFIAGMLLLDSATVYHLFRPQRRGFFIALAALALSLTENVVAIALALADLEGVREAYVEGRAMRGLSIGEESLDLIFRPQIFYLMLAGLLLLYALIAFIILRNRKYFFHVLNRADAT